jgi:hypothetical protein
MEEKSRQVLRQATEGAKKMAELHRDDPGCNKLGPAEPLPLEAVYTGWSEAFCPRCVAGGCEQAREILRFREFAGIHGIGVQLVPCAACGRHYRTAEHYLCVCCHEPFCGLCPSCRLDSRLVPKEAKDARRLATWLERRLAEVRLDVGARQSPRPRPLLDWLARLWK